MRRRPFQADHAWSILAIIVAHSPRWASGPKSALESPVPLVSYFTELSVPIAGYELDATDHHVKLVRHESAQL